MALEPYLIKVVNDQRDLVLALEDPDITRHAKLIAYYSAMRDAAIDDPMDDPEDQKDILALLESRLQEHIETYQDLVNNAL